MTRPGYLDFISEGLGRVARRRFGAGGDPRQHGVGVGTDRVWNYATEYGIPKIIVVNALDKENGISTRYAGASCANISARRVFPLTVPVNPGPGFNQVLDVLRNEVVTYAADTSGKFTEEPATGELAEQVKELHGQLIEHIAESDDALDEQVLRPGRVVGGGVSRRHPRRRAETAFRSRCFARRRKTTSASPA